MKEIKPTDVACINCKFGTLEENSKQVLCRYMPPHPVLMQVPNPRAQLDPKQPAFNTVSQALPPAVAQDWWCGQFAKRTGFVS